jgi:hypothetical protein
VAVLGTWPDERVAIASDEYTSKNVGLICYQIVLNQKRKKEKGKRRKEKGERRKEKGERRKEKGERRNYQFWNRVRFDF